LPAILPGPDEIDAGGVEDPTVVFSSDKRLLVFYTGDDARREQGALLVPPPPKERAGTDITFAASCSIWRLRAGKGISSCITRWRIGRCAAPALGNSGPPDPKSHGTAWPVHNNHSFTLFRG
jgi:hypothetical protein